MAPTPMNDAWTSVIRRSGSCSGPLGRLGALDIRTASLNGATRAAPPARLAPPGPVGVTLRG